MKVSRLPAGFSPVLASARATPESQRVPVAIAVGVFCIGFGFFTKLRGLDWYWTIISPMLLYAFCIGVSFALNVRAGDGWFANCKVFIRTDRLTKLRAIIRLTGTYIEMTDADGHYLDSRLCDITQNPDVWELVLAGVHVSVARGLKINDNFTARIFETPKYSVVATR